nr:alpha-1,2-fucosyltransferase [Haloferula luteola]
MGEFPIESSLAPASLRLGSSRSFRHRSRRLFDRFFPADSRSYWVERKSTRPSDLLNFSSSRKTIFLNGYWQDGDYFRDFATPLRRELTPPPLEVASDLALEQEFLDQPSVFVHIRRVRYSPRLDSDYYQRALVDASQRVSGVRFEVFGDDLAWARTHLDFGALPVRFHDGDVSNELRDFRLMQACRHAIVANSSFSWWAAWLRDSETKWVWTPENPGWPVVPEPHWLRIANRLDASLSD